MKLLNYLALALFIGVAITSCKENKKDDDSKKIIFTADAPKPIGPYSQAVLADDFLYISGQLAIDPATGKLDTTDITSQTKRVMENLNAILKAAGMDFTNVVKTTIFITDMSSFAKINDIYSGYFKADPPARETVQVAKLPKNGTIEISMIAYK
jgi:2-iminobutanoate/2-iminopropanoate deaminase